MNLKPYTRYRCPDPECGKGSRWTGAMTTPPRPNDGQCLACGAEYIEDIPDGHWRLTWEMVSPFRFPELYVGDRVRPGVTADQLNDSYWHPVAKESERGHEIKAQRDGLLHMVGEGELIRNVQLFTAPPTGWVEVRP